MCALHAVMTCPYETHRRGKTRVFAAVAQDLLLIPAAACAGNQHRHAAVAPPMALNLL